MARLLVIFFFLLAAAVTSAESDNHILLPTDTTTANICPIQPHPTTCPVKCFRTDPVCGADGVTYWCGCPDALCAGARVVKLGFCDVENGSSASGQAFLLVHIVWLILLGISVVFGFL